MVGWWDGYGCGVPTVVGLVVLVDKVSISCLAHFFYDKVPVPKFVVWFPNLGWGRSKFIGASETLRHGAWSSSQVSQFHLMPICSLLNQFLLWNFVMSICCPCILATFTMSRSEPFFETFKRNRPASCKAPRKIDSRDSRGVSTGRQIAWTCWWLCCHAWFRGGRTDLRKSPDVDVQLSFMTSTSVFISEENKEWSESTMILLHSVTHPGEKKLLHLDCFKMRFGKHTLFFTEKVLWIFWKRKTPQGSETDVPVGFTSTACFFQGTVNMVPESWQILHWLPIARTGPQRFGWKSYGNFT